MVIYTSTKPPRLAGVRYGHIFLLLQCANAVRYYTCPDELNFRMPHFTHITMIIIMLANAAAFFHGLDGNKHNWEVVQHCMLIVGGVYMFNVTVCLYYSYRANGKSDATWDLVWDQLLHWHETFVTSAMWTIARTEAKYFDVLDLLEKTNAEYSSHRPRRQRRRATKNDDEGGGGENGKRAARYYN